MFDSLEQALSLPIAKADNGPRWSGERDQFVARMNEAAPESPVDYKGGIPQALMLMNGKITADATSLDSSRTLRAVVEAPFLPPQEKIETLYLAAVTRKPSPEELKYLLDHVQGPEGRRAAEAGLCPDFVGVAEQPRVRVESVTGLPSSYPRTAMKRHLPTLLPLPNPARRPLARAVSLAALAARPAGHEPGRRPGRLVQRLAAAAGPGGRSQRQEEQVGASCCG